MSGKKYATINEITIIVRNDSEKGHDDMAELLAPAGSLDTVLTAIDAGADAIYLGGKLFNARKFAHNLADDELRQAVTTAHLFGVRIYVTVNILMADKELHQLGTYLQFLDTIGVDGIIVQDFAVAAMARQVAPNLPLHGSTQMTVADIDGVRFLASLGFTQAVLSRELGLTEIRDICRQSPIPIEVFIHGAQCVSYSGQCLMSSFIGGRSGNRGACAQPCRLPYTLLKNGQAVTKEDMYLLSLKDLSSPAYLTDLLEAGVASFKIEGRMKGTNYVRAVVSAYRSLLDATYRSPGERKTAQQQARIALEEAFNRTYQQDFLTQTVGRQTVTAKAGGNQGRRLGTVTAVRGSEITAVLTEPVQAGDMIKVCAPSGAAWVDEVQEAVGSFTKRHEFTLTLRRQDVGTGILFRLAKRDDRADQGRTLTRKIPLYAHVDVNQAGVLRLTVWDETGHTAEVLSEFTPPLAAKRPATTAWAAQQLARLGDTAFTLRDVTLWAETYMIPASVLNQLRRQAVEEIEQQILAEYQRPRAGKLSSAAAVKVPAALPPQGLGLSLRCDTLEAIEGAGKNGVRRVIFGGESFHHRPFTAALWQQAVRLAKSYGLEIWAATPRVVKEARRADVEAEVTAAVRAGCDGIYVGALSIFTMIERLAGDIPVYADWSLNIFNAQAAAVYTTFGCQGLTVSPEATLKQVEDMTRRVHVPVEALVAGRLEMMVTEYCAIAAFAGSGRKAGCPAVCTKGTYALEDRKDNILPLGTDQYCHVHVLNSRDLDMIPYIAKLRRAGLTWLRLEGRGRDSAWIAQTARLYSRVCNGQEQMVFSKENKDITRGHFFHGIL